MEEDHITKAIEIRRVVTGLNYDEGLHILISCVCAMIAEIDDDKEKLYYYTKVFNFLLESASEYITQDDIDTDLEEVREIIDLMDAEAEGWTH